MARSSLLALLLCHCSLLVDTSVDLLRCSEELDENGDQKCLTGYSCRYGDCVANHSLKFGDTCSRNVQCSGTDLFCPLGIPVCARACDKIYGDDPKCSDEQVCVPVPGSSTMPCTASSVKGYSNQSGEHRRRDKFFFFTTSR